MHKLIYRTFFNGVLNGTCMECGALDGKYLCICDRLEKNYGWKCINIEPNPESFKKLEQNRTLSVNLNVALSNENGMLHFLCAKKKKLSKVIKSGGIYIPCKTYKTVIEELKIESLDLFILDVEKHEREVILGMRECNVLPTVFVVEAHKIEDKKRNDEAIDQLESKYEVVSKISYNYVYVKK